MAAVRRWWLNGNMAFVSDGQKLTKKLLTNSLTTFF